MRNAVESNGHQRRRPRGGGWADAWDSSSDQEDTTNQQTGHQEPSCHDTARPILAHSNTAPIAVPTSVRGLGLPPHPAGVHDNNDRDTAPVRSSSYAHISPPSPSSYGPRTDWTVLGKAEITEAEKVYEVQRKDRLREASSSKLADAESSSNGFPSEAVTSSGNHLPSKSLTRSVAGLSKSFLNIALGAPHSSSSLRNSSVKGKGKEITAFTEQAASTSYRKQAYGRNVIRSDIDEILRDPLHMLKEWVSSDPVAAGARSDASSPLSSMPQSQGVDICYSSDAQSAASSKRLGRARSLRSERRRERFAKVLSGKIKDRAGSVDSAELRKMAWSGIPQEFRHIAWQMLLNYLPLPQQPRLTTLARKRREYAQLVEQVFGRGMTPADAQIWHQIEIDVPRTRPGVPLWSCEATQRSLERILYVRAMRNPASGYVQGINDLVTPFFEVFLGAYITCDPELFDVTHLPSSVLAAIEADSFWCLSKLLDGIQDNYITAQPGIHRLVRRMTELVRRIDPPLAMHLEDQGVEFMQFAFRWMNCLLMREISVKCTIRMWDTYLAEGTDAFSQFHLYVCSAFLVKWSERLKEMDFQEIIMFLQCLPTQDWQDHDIELLLSEAFVLKSVWQGAENHFAGQSTR
ncbi:hypothetical protein NliqN6_3750 [Naganishia liquefaciens]|uniref:Rab-GAP TBC domain-containing protein n=1 Tax=Naganishia liquefaciens TaxID=104408 RepID=A0A8H3TUW9_9TREE|nr:hypothetical protein NliqN6_3750 [Naganishia liquefaciens]